MACRFSASRDRTRGIVSREASSRSDGIARICSPIRRPLVPVEGGRAHDDRMLPGHPSTPGPRPGHQACRSVYRTIRRFLAGRRFLCRHRFSQHRPTLCTQQAPVRSVIIVAGGFIVHSLSLHSLSWMRRSPTLVAGRTTAITRRECRRATLTSPKTRPPFPLGLIAWFGRRDQ